MAEPEVKIPADWKEETKRRITALRLANPNFFSLPKSNGFSDLEKIADDCAPNWLLDDYFYDWKLHDRIVGFFVKFLTLTRGKSFKKKAFVPQDWQIFNLIGPLFCWMCTADGFRRFLEGLFSTGRKNGKTETIAAIHLIVLMLDKEPSGQQYCSSMTKEQSEELFEAVTTMIAQKDYLAKKFEVIPSSLAIKHYDTQATFQVVSNNPDTIHGFKPYFSTIDEYHLEKTPELKGIYKGGGLADDQAMLVIFGTVGKNKKSPMGAECQKATQLLNGDIHMPNYFAYLCQAPEQENGEDLDPYSERAIMIANPGYPIAPKKKAIDQWIANAKLFADDEYMYHWAILNRWAGALGAPIKPTVWQNCADLKLWERMLGRNCIAGFDLGSTDDLTALVLNFVDEGMPAWLPFFFMPKLQVDKRKKEHGQPYDEWAKMPHPFLPAPFKLLELTNGEMTDHEEIIAFTDSLKPYYEILQARRDKHLARMMGATMMKDGWIVIDINQDFPTMAPGCREVITRLSLGKFRHPSHPILNWMSENVRLEYSRRKSGQYVFSKDSAIEKIDGFDAGVIGLTGIFDELEELMNERPDYSDMEIW